MMTIVAIFLGGGAGALCRYAFLLLTGGSVMGGEGLFLLLVNGLGSFCVGLASGFLYDKGWISAFIMIGFLGGLTTFSALSLNMIRMIQTQSWLESLLHGITLFVMPVALCYAGMLLALFLTR